MGNDNMLLLVTNRVVFRDVWEVRCRDKGATGRMFKFSVKIWQSPLLIPTVSASSWIARRRSSRMSSRIFSIHFCSFGWCSVALNVHLQLTLDRPWNVNDIEKPLSGLMRVLQRIYRASCKTWRRQLLTARWHVTNWCNRLAEVWLLPPLSSSFAEAVATISVRELSVILVYAQLLFWFLYQWHGTPGEVGYNSIDIMTLRRYCWCHLEEGWMDKYTR
jgi:hypothetical protein